MEKSVDSMEPRLETEVPNDVLKEFLHSIDSRWLYPIHIYGWVACHPVKGIADAEKADVYTEYKGCDARYDDILARFKPLGNGLSNNIEQTMSVMCSKCHRRGVITLPTYYSWHPYRDIFGKIKELLDEDHSEDLWISPVFISRFLDWELKKRPVMDYMRKKAMATDSYWQYIYDDDRHKTWYIRYGGKAFESMNWMHYTRNYTPILHSDILFVLPNGRTTTDWWETPFSRKPGFDDALTTYSLTDDAEHIKRNKLTDSLRHSNYFYAPIIDDHIHDPNEELYRKGDVFFGRPNASNLKVVMTRWARMIDQRITLGYWNTYPSYEINPNLSGTNALRDIGMLVVDDLKNHGLDSMMLCKYLYWHAVQRQRFGRPSKRVLRMLLEPFDKERRAYIRAKSKRTIRERKNGGHIWTGYYTRFPTWESQFDQYSISMERIRNDNGEMHMKCIKIGGEFNDFM